MTPCLDLYKNYLSVQAASLIMLIAMHVIWGLKEKKKCLIERKKKMWVGDQCCYLQETGHWHISAK